MSVPSDVSSGTSPFMMLPLLWGWKPVALCSFVEWLTRYAVSSSASVGIIDRKSPGPIGLAAHNPNCLMFHQDVSTSSIFPGCTPIIVKYPINFIYHHDVDPPVPNILQKTLQCRTLHGSSGKAAIV